MHPVLRTPGNAEEEARLRAGLEPGTQTDGHLGRPDRGGRHQVQGAPAPPPAPPSRRPAPRASPRAPPPTSRPRRAPRAAPGPRPPRWTWLLDGPATFPRGGRCFPPRSDRKTQAGRSAKSGTRSGRLADGERRPRRRVGGGRSAGTRPGPADLRVPRGIGSSPAPQALLLRGCKCGPGAGRTEFFWSEGLRGPVLRLLVIRPEGRLLVSFLFCFVHFGKKTIMLFSI